MSAWEHQSLTEARLCQASLEAMCLYIESQPGANVHGILIARHGAIAFERYWPGADEVWGRPVGLVEHGPESRHDLRSVTKGVVALLVGIAQEQGLLPSLDVPVLDVLPDLADLRGAGRDDITLRHLLTMTAGLDWNEIGSKIEDNDEVRMILAADPYRFAVDRAVVAAPGVLWNYNGGCTELLAAALSRVTGRSLDAFAAETLFGPLGIKDVEWSRLPGNAAPSASSGLRLRLRDFAKLGQIVLTGGTWRDRRIAAQAWIREATAPQVGPPDRLLFYGYQWWLGRSLVRGREIPWISAQGLGGQRLFVVPDFDLVFVMTAGVYGDPMQVWLPLVALNRFVLQAAA